MCVIGGSCSHTLTFPENRCAPKGEKASHQANCTRFPGPISPTQELGRRPACVC